MIKSALRKIYKQKRLALSEAERMKMDDLLLIQFQRLPFNNVNCLMTFSAIEVMGETNVEYCARYLQHLIPGLQICYPVVDSLSNDMKAVVANDETLFADNLYGIAEPVGGNAISPREIDMVLVPLLAFDEFGYRVGYGKGFYDRFLKTCRSNVSTVGFSYFQPVAKIEDTNEFDVPLNYCITPEKLYEF